MASNHVQPDQNSQNVGGHGEGSNGFNYNNFYAHGQNFPNTLQPGQRLQQSNGTPSHSPYNATSAFNPPSAWQSTATSSASSAPLQTNQYMTAKPTYNAPSASPYSLYGNSNHVQFNSQNVDPALFRQSDHRSYGHNSVMPPAASTTSTIAPAALHQAAPLHRQNASPGASMQNTFSAQPTNNQYRDMSQTVPLSNGTAQAHTINVPKGTQSGRFILVNFETLAKSTQSKRLHNFVNVAQAPVDLNLNRVNIPQYVPRKSQNELRELAGKDAALRTKILKRGKKARFLTSKTVRSSQSNDKASPVSLSSETESSGSESDSEYESGSPMPEKSPLPAVRPQKIIEAVKYDTIKAVWLPRNKFAENAKLLAGLAALWDVVKTVRDRWKKDKEAVKSAVDTKQMADLPLLRERVENQVEMMEVVLNAAVTHGHPDLLSVCGQNGPLMSTCYSFMLDPVRDGNYSTTFIKVVFKFLSMCTNLNSELAEKSSLSKLFLRSAKRGTDEIKALTAKINANIAASDKKAKSTSAKPADVKAVNVKTESPKVRPESNPVTGVKRPRPVEGLNGQPAKRLASTSVAATANQSTAAKLGLVKKPTAATPAASSTNTSAKPVAKPTTSFFAGLQSASKRPRTDAAPAATKKGPIGTANDKKAPIPSAAKATPRPAFSFAETMANLSKEQKKEPVKKAKSEEEETRGPETEEEKAKRLRKEARRSLRVRWDDANLEQVKEFSRDPSELPSRTSNRDVKAGNEQEGLTLKKHMDMMDIDGEDDDQPMEQSFSEYRDPSDVDFSVLPADERTRNYKRFGGEIECDSTEQQVQENRAANTLMEHYLSKSEIPANPREPVDLYNGPQLEYKDFGQPDEPWLMSRLSNFAALAPPPPAQDISSLLQAIGGIIPQAAQPAAIPNLSALSSILPQQQPHAQQPDFSWSQAQQQPPVLEANTGTKSLEEILAELGGNAKTAAPPAPQAPMPFAPPPPPQAQPSTDVSAMIAQLMQNAQGAAGNAGGFSGFGQAPSPGNFFGASSTTPDQYGNNANAGDQDGKQKRKWDGGKKYTYPCKFWKEGKCKKGDACTFRHDN